MDGTLVTSAKVLAPSTIRAARMLKERGIALAITSSRPPRGLLQFIEALGIDTPTGSFNGGALVKPDLTVIAQSVLPAALAQSVVALIREQGLDVWAYSADDWYVQDPEGPHVAREQRTVQFAPTVVDSYDQVIDRVVKIVGVTDDPALMAEAERVTRERFGTAVSASRSQAYYLDVTHPDANKGDVVAWLSTFLDIPPGAHRHHRRRAQRYPDVSPERVEHRHGQCRPRGQGRSDGWSPRPMTRTGSPAPSTLISCRSGSRGDDASASV